jgi:hypothetical protein
MWLENKTNREIAEPLAIAIVGGGSNAQLRSGSAR